MQNHVWDKKNYGIGVTSSVYTTKNMKRREWFQVFLSKNQVILDEVQTRRKEGSKMRWILYGVHNVEKRNLCVCNNIPFKLAQKCKWLLWHVHSLTQQLPVRRKFRSSKWRGISHIVNQLTQLDPSPSLVFFNLKPK